MGLRPPMETKVPLALIPSGARDLLFVPASKIRFLVGTLLGMTMRLDDFRRTKRSRSQNGDEKPQDEAIVC